MHPAPGSDRAGFLRQRPIGDKIVSHRDITGLVNLHFLLPPNSKNPVISGLSGIVCGKKCGKVEVHTPENP